ncbi:TetR/AcrR family transcriptional regulator [Sphaerisporangium fuscum]|uniref:TetR/AcrR family transcriptional regulator n=1 Tax=Sphaerisporangium fuscum TaxID=2835868 RepID=UPI001BDC2669|nr:TetR/AcrR family transcriptional regulator [Sphaerisporangium fuscum]
MCGRTLRPAERGRPPRYCSRACRARAYRIRVAEHSTAGVQGEARRTAEPTGAGHPEAALDRSLVVRAAIEIADQEGVAAVSMRRIATRLDAGAMSLYRYVASREELNDLMVDTVFGERPLPEPGPDGWRARLELSAREEWAIYRDHPWVSHLVAVTTRPPVAPNLMAYTDWRMRALQGHGLDFTTMVQVAIMIGTYLQSAAVPLAHEALVARTTRQQWADARQGAVDQTLRAARLPMISEFGPEAFEASEPENVFEFGLHRMLDGIAALLASAE